MIAFDLQCANSHIFEGWFEDIEAYKSQNKNGLIRCPVCDDATIARIPSAFAIKTSDGGSPADMQQVVLTALSRKISRFVEKNFDNVGAEFAREALKIHYGVSKPRNIRGVSTKEEEKTLEKEGVEFYKVPLISSPDSETD